ncbi:MAG TPA: DUF86 domain-containing protein [bacterium]|nr:DUF86 domain-containing protein [bacterium]HON72567.1 DUF86 domain-containing protein [bacterium]
MREIEKGRVLEKLNIINDSLLKLEELASLSIEQFMSDFRNYDSAKYNLIKAIEAMIDVGNHIIARRGLGIPKSFSETFEILGNNGIVSKDSVETYKAMARFRNRLVHFYYRVDDKEVYDILKNNLLDFENFIESIELFLKSL